MEKSWNLYGRQSLHLPALFNPLFANELNLLKVFLPCKIIILVEITDGRKGTSHAEGQPVKLVDKDTKHMKQILQ